MLVALIVRRERRLTMSEWKLHIRGSDVLVPLETRKTINPFTGTPTTLEPNEGDVWIVVKDVRIGAVEPDPQMPENGELLVYADDGKEEEVREAATAIASSLGASLEWIPPDKPV